MDHRQIHLQLTAAAKAGISERSGRRIDRDPTLPSQRKKPRVYRTRPAVRGDLGSRDRAAGAVDAVAAGRSPSCASCSVGIPDAFRIASCAPCSAIRRWSALAGPDRDVIFRQEHPPGAQGLSGLTDAGELCVTMAGLAFPHRLYHFALAHSQWEYARVVEEWGELLGARRRSPERALAHRWRAARASYRQPLGGVQEPLRAGGLHARLPRAVHPLRHGGDPQQSRCQPRERLDRKPASPSQDGARPGPDAARQPRLRHKGSLSGLCRRSRRQTQCRPRAGLAADRAALLPLRSGAPPASAKPR